MPEGLRAADWLKKDGLAITSRTRLVPAIVTSSKDFSYPTDPVADLQSKVAKTIPVEADIIAGELGNPRLVNTILLGVMSNYLPFEKERWVDAIRARVKPKFVDINITALERGREITLDAVGAGK